MNTQCNRQINLRGRAVIQLRRALQSRARDIAQTAIEIGFALGAGISAVLTLNLFPEEPEEPVLRLVPAATCAVLLLGGALLTVGQNRLDRHVTRRWHRVRAFANDALGRAARVGAAGRPAVETAVERLEAWAAIDGPWMSAGSRRVIQGHIDDLRASADRWGARRTT